MYIYTQIIYRAIYILSNIYTQIYVYIYTYIAGVSHTPSLQFSAALATTDGRQYPGHQSALYIHMYIYTRSIYMYTRSIYMYIRYTQVKCGGI